MKFGVITQHNKDSCSDKIEPRQLVWHIEATFSWQRPSEIWKEKRRAYLNIWFYFILLSKGFRIGGEKRGGGRLLLDEREREWLLQWLKSEKNQICFPCMHAAAAKEQNSPPPTAATTTSLLSRTPHHRHRPPSHRHTKASYLQRRPSPLMTASLHSTDHSALKPFFLEERISAPFTPYRDQMTSLKATDSRLICEIGGARNFLYSGHWRESWREAVRNFIPEISAPQTAVTRPSFHPPLLHLT